MSMSQGRAAREALASGADLPAGHQSITHSASATAQRSREPRRAPPGPTPGNARTLPRHAPPAGDADASNLGSFPSPRREATMSSMRPALPPPGLHTPSASFVRSKASASAGTGPRLTASAITVPRALVVVHEGPLHIRSGLWGKYERQYCALALSDMGPLWLTWQVR